MGKYIQFVCSGVSNEHRYFYCAFIAISSEEIRINVQLNAINVQEWAFLLRKSEEIGYNCTFMLISSAKMPISSENTRK